MSDRRYRIAFLADHPDAVPVVSGWLFEEWGERLDQSLQETAETVRSWLARDQWPLALIALAGSEPIGVVSLVEEETPLESEPVICLNSLYVVPEWRGRGVGLRLEARAVLEARRLGLSVLGLYTRDAEYFYYPGR